MTTTQACDGQELISGLCATAVLLSLIAFMAFAVWRVTR